MISPNNLANFLGQYLETARFPDEPPIVLRHFGRSVARLGLALEPGPGLMEWVAREKLDALFLHRPYKLEHDSLPDGVGVLGSHLPFEQKLTLGCNLRLADALGMSHVQHLGKRRGRVVGMIGDVPPQTVAAFYRSAFEVFGGREDARTCERNEVTKVAVVGAMTPELMHEATERGAEVYITGQMRAPGRETLMETGLGLIIVGHRRSEEWALRALAHVLRERFADLHICLPPRRAADKADKNVETPAMP